MFLLSAPVLSRRLRELGKFIKSIAVDIAASAMELSKKKSVFTANSDKLGEKLEETWQDLGIKYQKYVKSLGVGMAAGRRNVKEQVKRLKCFKERIPRFRKLAKLGVDPAMIVRAGGKAGIVYGESTMGLSNSLLQSQRRAVAAAVAPQHGSGDRTLI